MPAADQLAQRLGRVATVQADSRFCDLAKQRAADVIRLHQYWWASAHVNYIWAERHNYESFFFCIRRCTRCNVSSGPWRVKTVALVPTLAWCKLVAVATILTVERYDTVLYLDSDVHIAATSLPLHALLHPYVWEGDLGDGDDVGASLLFGCNAPFPRGWPPRIRNHISGEQQQLVHRGPPNSGFFLARNSARTLQLLRSWWSVDSHAVVRRRMWPWHQRWQDQGGLWDLMLANGSEAASRIKVLAIPGNATSRGLSGWADRLSKPVVGLSHCFQTMGLLGDDKRARYAARHPGVEHLDHHHFKSPEDRTEHVASHLRATLAAQHSDQHTGQPHSKAAGGCRMRLVELKAGQSEAEGVCDRRLEWARALERSVQSYREERSRCRRPHLSLETLGEALGLGES